MMSAQVETQIPSPQRGQPRVQEGRVQKPRFKNGVSVNANYRIGGRTFACEGCKNGHRVSKCTHASERPLHMTNDPGRPSATQKRYCDCPRTCSCTKKNCKCDRKCSCTQIMYMLVWVPLEGQDQKEQKEQKGQKENGEWRIGKEVVADLRGKPLSDEEVKRRTQMKALPRGTRTIRASTIGTTSTQIPPALAVRAEASSPDKQPSPKQSCCHRKNIQEEEAMVPVPKIEPTQATNLRKKCECQNCVCLYCLEHPNNEASQRNAQYRAAQFTGLNMNSDAAYLGPSGNDLSCRGTNPHFAWHTSPNPSMLELQNLFGQRNMTSQGYVLSYPIRSFSPAVGVNPQSGAFSISKSNDLQGQGSDVMNLAGPSSCCAHTPSLFAQGQRYPQTPDNFQMPEEAYGLSSMTQTSDIPDVQHYVGQAMVTGIYGSDTTWNNTLPPPGLYQSPLDWSSTPVNGIHPQESCQAAGDYGYPHQQDPSLVLPMAQTSLNLAELSLGSYPHQHPLTNDFDPTLDYDYSLSPAMINESLDGFLYATGQPPGYSIP